MSACWFGLGALLTFLYLIGFAECGRVWLAPTRFITGVGPILGTGHAPNPSFMGGLADGNQTELLTAFPKNSPRDRDYSLYFPPYATILNPMLTFRPI